DELEVILDNAFIRATEFAFDAIIVCCIFCFIVSFFMRIGISERGQSI
ncbi:hypothetical protein C5S29_03095, partial [ANME-1 cluster archaeon GoMg3.2]|nr:hypothetical protein [ANME-1 cluster archaeon GoMg3.2]